MIPRLSLSFASSFTLTATRGVESARDPVARLVSRAQPVGVNRQGRLLSCALIACTANTPRYDAWEVGHLVNQRFPVFILAISSESVRGSARDRRGILLVTLKRTDETSSRPFSVFRPPHDHPRGTFLWNFTGLLSRKYIRVEEKHAPSTLREFQNETGNESSSRLFCGLFLEVREFQAARIQRMGVSE